MPTKIESLKKGDKLYDIHRERAGNTTMTRERCWEVFVRDVGVDDRGAWAELTWNGNPPRRKTYGTTRYTRWPKEWLAADPWDGGGKLSGPRCYICSGRKDHGGHKRTCEHPKAIAARKRTSK